MALIGSLGALVGTACFALLAAALGHRLLRAFGLEFDSDAESVLCSAAVGVIAIEAALFWAQMAPTIRMGVATVLVIALVVGGSDIFVVLRKVRNIAMHLLAGSRSEKLLLAFGALLLAFEGVAAMAPLTGSDALQYHFAEPLRILQTGFHPNFFFIHSFYIGQGHLLILAGLAAGSEKLAMGLIFLGGVLSAAAVACLAQMWMSREWALLVALSFLTTPVVFWQASAAGNPEIWLSFFATMAAIVLARMNRSSGAGYAALVGILAGAIAGGKYTGCLVAAGIAIAFVWETRSLRAAMVFVASALSAGIWPYARNWVWTGDPAFPYLLHLLMPSQVNSYTLAHQLSYAGRTVPATVLDLARFSVFTSIDRADTGFWEFLGPLTLAFAPALFLAVRNTSAWRASLIVWLTSAISIGASSPINRYLLVVFPVALAAVFAGIAQLNIRGWRIAGTVTRAVVYLFILVGTGGLFLYSHAAFGAAIGMTGRQNYLLRRAPDYGKTEFLNSSLGGEGSPDKVLVFFPHVYYLRVPFVRANPDASWAIDPLHFQSEKEWQTLFREQHIAWVVRTTAFPDAIAEPLNKMEAEGVLVPFVQGEANDFAGYRIEGQRQAAQVVILRVKP